jgi:hypothetical protein
MKTKYQRRRALNCTLIEKSKSHPEYFKYDVTIGEKDGTVHTEPAYGKDMQDALSRLINKERTIKVEKKLENNTGIIFLVWLVVMGGPAFFVEHHTPWFLVYSMGSIVVLVCLAAWWYHYVNKS